MIEPDRNKRFYKSFWRHKYCTKLHGNPFISYKDISLKIKAVYLMVELKEKSRDCNNWTMNVCDNHYVEKFHPLK